MNICLIGYGKMGKAIELILTERGHSISGIVHRTNIVDLPTILSKSDVAIEFTGPESAFEMIIQCFNAGVPVVSGSTGWLDHWDAMVDHQSNTNGTLLWASNFSIGVNLFFEINKLLAKLAQYQKEYSYSIQEIHHTAKLDIPSGTALTLVSDILENHQGYEGWILDPQQKQDRLIPLEAKREGSVIGYHKVNLQGANDQITLIHEAYNRNGFALGAVIAAEWIKEKKGIFSMSDLLQL